MTEPDPSNPEPAIVLDAEPTEQYRHSINVQHAQTRNRIALILIWAVVLSLPVYLVTAAIAVAKSKESAISLDKVFDRWFSLVGPLAGTAVGAYYVSSKKAE